VKPFEIQFAEGQSHDGPYWQSLPHPKVVVASDEGAAILQARMEGRRDLMIRAIEVDWKRFNEVWHKAGLVQ
jgi:hypothetical protein